MRKRVRECGCVVVMIVGVLSGCDSPVEVPQPSVVPSEMLASETGQQAYLQAIAQLVALSLGDQGLRTRLANDMRTSPYTEHKVDVEAYLRGSRGGTLLAKMDQHSSANREELLKLLAYLPRLELYMPVAEHRESWEGTPDVLVSARRIDASEENTGTRLAYDVEGTVLALSPAEPPSRPTIVVGPAETDFARTIDMTRYANVNDRGGRSVGSYQLRRAAPSRAMCVPEVGCGSGGGGGGGGGGGSPPFDTVYVRGIGVREYIEYMWTPNDYEPWDQGAPEFELFFAATSDSDGASELKSRFWVPEDPWSGSDDDNNSRPRYFGGSGLTITTWDTDYGNRLLIECVEDDSDLWEHGDVVLKGTTVFADVTAEVSFEASWADLVGGWDDPCGENNVLLRTSTNVWTPIYNSSQDYRYFWDGFNDGPRWQGFGTQIVWP